MEQKPKVTKTNCCIAGGGPAGIMLGFLLARAGIDVIVLEKHADFFRDFRGDTIHPSTIEIMHELGLLEEFLDVPHQEYKQLVAKFNDKDVPIADFTHLPVAHPVLGIMPQWDFLNFLAEQASKYATFHLLMNAEVTDVIKEQQRVTGIRAMIAGETTEINAKLVVGADGRHSVVRKQAGLKVITTGAPIDVLWFRISKQPGDPEETLGRFYHGSIMVMIDRGEYWQCGYIIEKNGIDKIREKGLHHFREDILRVSPFLKNRTAEIKDWSDIKLLSVAIDHLQQWYTNGLLCIGDAAHAMSPVGGVGINLAVQDAVAAANMLWKPLEQPQEISMNVLAAIQKRRVLPMRMVQRMQVAIQKGIIYKRMDKHTGQMPLFFKMLRAWPLLRRIPARLVGMGLRPEHIKTPDINHKPK